jgi:hypothetical protein
MHRYPAALKSRPMDASLATAGLLAILNRAGADKAETAVEYAPAFRKYRRSIAMKLSSYIELYMP